MPTEFWNSRNQQKSTGYRVDQLKKEVIHVTRWRFFALDCRYKPCIKNVLFVDALKSLSLADYTSSIRIIQKLSLS